MKNKTIISPAHALLLLIEHYRKSDMNKVLELKRLYLSGVENKADLALIRKYFTEDTLSDYLVSFVQNVINNDPTRRYFETHFAYETLKNNLVNINYQDLQAHFNQLEKRVPKDVFAQFQPVLNGELAVIMNSQDEIIVAYNPIKLNSNFFKEYTNYISEINNGNLFNKFSQSDKNKIVLLVQCSFLGVATNWFVDLPLNIYHEGFYAAKNKGKVIIEGQESTCNQHLGLIKGHMPLSQEDIANAATPLPLMKPADQATFKTGALWINYHFNHLVHPFSNAISGTLLCQLRNIAQSQKVGLDTLTQSKQQISEYLKLFICAMLYGSGGHSLYEFTAPLSLPKVCDEFKNIPDFGTLNMETLFNSNNNKSFDSALDDTIHYMNQLNKRNELLTEIKENISATASISPYASFFATSTKTVNHTPSISNNFNKIN